MIWIYRFEKKFGFLVVVEIMEGDIFRESVLNGYIKDLKVNRGRRVLRLGRVGR